MPSPFPGMDPYLERHWWDIHAHLVPGISNELNKGLPEDLVARNEERVAIESDPSERRSRIGPDVRVFEAVGPGVVFPEPGGEVALAPLRLRSLFEPATERFVKILDADSEKLITVVEVVSPTNKTGRGLKKFQSTRDRLVDAGVNVVEIDLVRQGNWRKLIHPHIIPFEGNTTYRTTLRVANKWDESHLHPMPLREPLPTINIPLRVGEKVFRLNLQPLIDHVYDGGRYARTLDYNKPCDPPLDQADEVWADELLRGAGKRAAGSSTRPG